MRKLITALVVAALSVGLVVSTVAFGATKKVGVKGLAFTPKKITVTKGTTVVWHWKTGGVPHNLKGKGFGTGTPKATVTYRHKFTKAGTYKYVCTIHKAQGMTGTVVVR